VYPFTRVIFLGQNKRKREAKKNGSRGDLPMK
jgi:hypothetical protein